MLARHDAGPRPARPRRRRRAAGGRRGRPRGGAASEVAAIPVEAPVRSYIVAIARATRESPSLALGVSPRGATMLLHAAKAWAWLAGKHVRHPRRGEGRGQADPAPPHPAAARGRARGRHRRRRARRRPRRRPCPVPRRERRMPGPDLAGWPVAACRPGGWSSARASLVALVDARRRPGCGRGRTGLLLVAAVVDWLLAVRPGELEVERELPGDRAPRQPRPRSAWRVAQPEPASAACSVRLADELAPSLRAATQAGAAGRCRPTGRATARDRRCGRRGGAGSRPTEIVLRVEGPLRAGRPPGPAAAARRCCGCTRRSDSRDEAELRINKARILEVGLRSAQGRGGGTEFDPLREYSSTTSSAGSTGRPPPAPASRSCAPTGPSGTRRCCCCSTTAGRWPAGSTTCPASSTPWTR